MSQLNVSSSLVLIIFHQYNLRVISNTLQMVPPLKQTYPISKGDILVTWQQSQVFGTQPVFIFSPLPEKSVY